MKNYLSTSFISSLEDKYKKKCPICNKKFKGHLNRLYCGNDCYYKSRLLAYKKKPRKFTKRKCKYCNKEFMKKNHNHSFCSKNCREDYLKDVSNGKIIPKENNFKINYYKMRFEIFKRDNFTCQYCGRNVKEDKIKLNCDHIHPASKGGLWTFDNLITSCEECNLGKGDILLKEHKLNKRYQK